MQGDVRPGRSWADIQELNHPAQHGDAAWLPIIARVTVLKGVGAFECEPSVFISCRFDACEGDGRVEELHFVHMALAARTIHGDLVNTGAFEPQPEKTTQKGDADDFKP